MSSFEIDDKLKSLCPCLTGCAAVLQLFRLLEAQSVQVLQPGHLHMAFLAHLQLGDATAACDAATRHAPLAAAWTAQQQGRAFNSALRVLQQQPFAHAALRAARQVWLLAVNNSLPDMQQQLYDLLLALLSMERLSDAHKVGSILPPPHQTSIAGSRGLELQAAQHATH